MKGIFMKKDIHHNIEEGFLFPVEEQSCTTPNLRLNHDDLSHEEPSLEGGGHSSAVRNLSPRIASQMSGKAEKIDRRRKPAIYEARPNLTLDEMRKFLMGLQEVESVKGIRYVKLHVTARMIIGIREASGKEFTINLEQLYTAYQKCLRFTSPEVKKYIFMGHSPAVVLLRMLQNRK